MLRYIWIQGKKITPKLVCDVESQINASNVLEYCYERGKGNVFRLFTFHIIKQGNLETPDVSF